MTVWHGHPYPAFVLPPGVTAALAVADRTETGFAELLEDLAGWFFSYHAGHLEG
jgi:hypothetical protein